MVEHMYSENVYFPDAFKGCKHECIYCKPSFQRQAKRQRQRCNVLNEKGMPKCYIFEPHAHLERLRKPSPKTVGKQFVFFPKGGDLAFAHPTIILEMLEYAKANQQTTFLMQTKDPKWMKDYRFSKNIVLAITLETDRTQFSTPSKFKNYYEISLAPSPFTRAANFWGVVHDRKAVIIEPILQHDSFLVDMIRPIKPEFVYIGYDNHNCQLPEPTLSETSKLIKELKKFTEVRLKFIREAWYKIPSQTLLSVNSE